MEIFNDFYMPLIVQAYTEKSDAFQKFSGGALNLTSAVGVGDFIKNSVWNNLGASRRVDRYAANDDVATTDLSQSLEVAVKVAGGFGPFGYEPTQLTWLKNPTEEAARVIAESYSSAILLDQINTAILALVSGIGNQSGLVSDTSASAGSENGISYKNIVRTNGKLGDHSQSIVAYVMNGICENNLRLTNYDNANALFTATAPNGTVNVVGGVLDKPVIVVDAPALTVATTGYNILGLQNMAVEVMYDPATSYTNIETKNGKERIAATIQTDYDFTIKLKNLSWDETNGGASPDDTDIGTGANWTLIGDKKLAAGVLTVVNQEDPA